MTGHALLIDLDGVIYQGDRVIDGAVDTIDWIGRERIPHLFVTNTTSRSRARLLQKFETLGFEAGSDEVMTPIVAATRYLQRESLDRLALFVPRAAQDEFDAFETVSPEQDCDVDAVVVGDLGRDWNFDLLNQAFRLLMRDPKPRLLALGMTRYWHAADGLQLDVAPFIKALEHAASCKAVVTGKPAAAFFDMALELLDCDASQALMIGDDIVGDVDAAQRCGIRGIQVRTGKFRDADLDGEIEPHAVLESIAALPDWWRGAG